MDYRGVWNALCRQMTSQAEMPVDVLWDARLVWSWEIGRGVWHHRDLC